MGFRNFFVFSTQSISQFWWSTWLFIIAWLLAIYPTHAETAKSELFKDEVYPLLKANCFECHGENVQHGNLRLDAKNTMLQGGKSGTAVTPGNAEASRLYHRLVTDDASKRMPLGREPLAEQEIELIKKWINQGAVWKEGLGSSAISVDKHWSFVLPQPDSPPTVDHNEWIQNPIDAFILEKMQKHDLHPSPEADRKKLIRRMYLDVIGLPPSLEELERYANDPSPNWKEALIDDLLASPHYGEKWGRHWLDAARYADTNGYEKDRPREIWPYRDYVIDSFNEDKPFDRFTIEQIAGDLLPNAGQEEKIATGFHRNTMYNEEGGVDVEEFRFESIVDRVNTASTVFLGLTVACAQCHTHKYDPITHKEYYRFFAYLNNCDEVKMKIPDENVKKKRRTVQQDIQTTISQLQSKVTNRNPKDQSIQVNSKTLEQAYQNWLESKTEQAQHWQTLRPMQMESQNHTLFKTLPDQSVLAYGDMPNNDVYTIEYESPIQKIEAIQLSMLRHHDLPGQGPGRGTVLQDGNFMLSEIAVEILSQDNPARNIKLSSAIATSHAKNATAGNAIDNDRNTGWSIKKHPLRPYQAVFSFKKPEVLKEGERLRITFDQNYIHTYTMGRFRVSVTGSQSQQPSGLPEALESALHLKKQLTETDRSLLRFYFLLDSAEFKEEQEKLVSLINSLPQPITTLVVQQRDVPRTTRIHHRGEYLQPREPVEPGVPSVLHPIKHNQKEPLRLQFARWLVSRENPLIARVTVNRIWMRYFGRGLVETVDDFGTRGSLPTHPKLLDWLAVEFMENGWSLKHIHRLILSSATYQQTSKLTPALHEKDPNNEWYARGSRFRLDGELIRDTALSISGLLAETIGGPSVFPPLPEGLGALSYGGLKWETDQGKDRFRRGLYTYWKRTNPYPMLTTFDAPSANTACVRRNRSNTPLQALTLLNDTVFVEAAQAFGKRIYDKTEKSVKDKIAFAFELCTARTPNENELEQLSNYYYKQYYRIDNNEINPLQESAVLEPDSNAGPAALGAWTMVARVLLNLDETITRE